jgi:hypothetical protein
LLALGRIVGFINQKLGPGVGLKILLRRVARHQIGLEEVFFRFGVFFWRVRIGNALMGRVTGSDVVGGGLGSIDVEPFGRGRMHENY